MRLGDSGIPAMVAHPDWESRVPVVIWMHGRTASKELDAGRYLRWVRHGFGACAIDLPWHGERADAAYHSAEHTMELLDRAVPEIDEVVAALRSDAFSAVFDGERLGIGGMSAGGMTALRRLCDDHPFRCAAVEGALGSFGERPEYADRHRPELLEKLDPITHLDTWRPIPFLALHSEADEMVPFSGIRVFVEALHGRYSAAGADPGLARLRSWPETGAASEHIGFGRYSNDAKNEQLAFFREHLLDESGDEG